MNSGSPKLRLDGPNLVGLRRVVVVIVALGLTIFAPVSSASALHIVGDLIAPPPAPPTEAPQAPAQAPDATLPAGSGEGRRVVYSTTRQRVWLVAPDGSSAGTWLVSGRTGAPGPGVYQVFSRSLNATARSGRVAMQHMVRFARTPGLPIGFHSIPVGRKSGSPIQSESELGQPRSAGCIRQRPSDAVAMWDFAHLGTQVVVVD
ncbi:MAG: L,D-transpeptidase [Actinomycetota bacterium]